MTRRMAAGWVSRRRSTLLIVGAALVAVLATAWLGRGQQQYTAALDPGNPGGNGAQALARVLGGQGVDVEVVRSAAGLDAARPDASTTIVVTSAGDLGRSTTTRLLAGQGPAQLVVVAPGPQLVRDLGLTTYPVVTDVPRPVRGRCPSYAGLALDVTTAAEYAAPGCFRGQHGSVVATPRSGLTLFGAPAAMTNDQILDGDNAAVTLRLLGGRSRLLWYVPSLADLAGGDSVSASSLLPDWLRPALWMLSIAGAGLVAWRARRLGPLAREPLPVEVKAIETTRNLGRLYRRAGDRTHAATAFRRAARARLTERLRLPRHASDDVLVAAVAERTGRPEAEVRALLADARLPAGDWVLTELARQLSELDREVSQP